MRAASYRSRAGACDDRRMFAFLLAATVTLVPGSFVRGQQPDGNSVILSGKRGLVVVDTGRHAAHTQ